MSVRRLEHIPGFHIDRVAAAAGDDPDVLRLENLDTDIPPPEAAMAATRAAIGEDEANSWLPPSAATTSRRPWPPTSSVAEGRADGRREIVITCGEGDAMLDALFCLTDPGTRSSSPTRPTRACSTGCGWSGRCPGLSRSRSPTGGGDSIWKRCRLHVRGLPEQRVVSVRVGGDRRGVGGGCLDLPRAGPWLLYWAGFEGVLFDGRPIRHPAALPGMRDRTVTVGAPSLEQRMIAWRGAVVAPRELVNDVARVQIYNGLVPSGFAQIGTRRPEPPR